MDDVVRRKRSPSESSVASVASVDQLLGDQDVSLSCVTDRLLRFADSNSEDDFKDHFYSNGLLGFRIIMGVGLVSYTAVCMWLAAFKRLQGVEFWVGGVLIFLVLFLLSFAPVLKRQRITKWSIRTVPAYIMLTGFLCRFLHCMARVQSGMSFPDVNFSTYLIGVYMGMRLPFDLAVLTCPLYLVIEFVFCALTADSLARVSIEVLTCISPTFLIVWAIRWVDWHTRCSFLLQLKLKNMTSQYEEKKQSTDQILANILPHQIIDAYVRGDRSFNRSHESCTVVFVKLLLPPLDVTNVQAGLALLNEMVSLLEAVCAEYGIEKVKTIGMTFMAVSGVPIETADHVQRAAQFALEAKRKVRKCGHSLQIGLHCGPVVTGVVGAKLVWDVWGDTVNLSSRMCALSQPNCIQVSPAIKAHLAGDRRFMLSEAPIAVNVKGKGLLQTFTLVDSCEMDYESGVNLAKAEAWLSDTCEAGDNCEYVRPPHHDSFEPLDAPLPCQASHTSSHFLPAQIRLLPSLVRQVPDIYYEPTDADGAEASANLHPFRSMRTDSIHSGSSTQSQPQSTPRPLTRGRLARLFAKHVLLRFPAKFTDKETAYWQQHYETSTTAVRQCLAIMLIQTAVNAVVEAHNHTLNRFWNVLLRYCLYSALILVMFRLTYMPVLHTHHARWITNLFLVLLTIIVCGMLWIDWSWMTFDYDSQQELTGEEQRMYSVMDAFFLSLVISLFPSGRLTDNIVLQLCLVGWTCGVCMPPPFAIFGIADFWIAGFTCWLREKETRNEFILKQQQLEVHERTIRETRTIQRLLQGCMPQSVLKEIHAAQLHLVGGNFRLHESVVVLATDIEGFTLWSSGVGAEMVVAMLDKLVTAMDSLVDKHNISKIKTIGDAYLAVAGLGGLDSSQLTAMAEFALDVQRLSQTFEAPDGSRMHMRIGVAIGSAAAGIIGTKKWFWDLWGQAVMHAEDLEKTGHVNEIHISKEISVMFARLGYRIQQQDTISYGPVSDATSVTNGTCVLVGGRGTLDMKTIEPDKKGG